MTRIAYVYGVPVELPEKCIMCDSVPTETIAALAAFRWARLLNRCAFCGLPIRMVGGLLEHVHSEREGNGWAIQHPLFEDSAWWSETGPFGHVEIYTHIPCAKEGMPFANFEAWVSRDDEIPPKNANPEIIIEEPCDVCGVMSNPEDVRHVIGRLYDVSHAHACVFCGDPIELRKIVIWHKDLSGNHSPDPKRWHFHDWKWEPKFRWTWPAPAPIGHLPFSGHLACARDKMRYATWDEPTKLKKRWLP